MNRYIQYLGIAVVAALLSVPATGLKAQTADPAGAETGIPADTLSGIFRQRCVLRPSKADSLGLQMDTVSLLYETYIGPLDTLNDPDRPERDIVIDPEYYRMFVPFTYYNRPLARCSKLEWEVPQAPQAPEPPADEVLPYDKAPFTSMERSGERVDRTMMQAYVDCPRLVRSTEDEIEQVRLFQDNIEGEKSTKKGTVKKLIKVEEAQSLTNETVTVRNKPNWWTTSGDGSFQMTQNYISSNWYKGGESTVSLLATLQLKADYNDNDKVQWENLLDAKLGIYSTPSDDYHNYLVSSDQLRLYSKLGIQATSKWYYTISTELSTQFLNNYEADEEEMTSAFLTPLDWTTNIGMDYKQKKDKYTLSVFLAPLTYTMRYMSNDKVDETDFGLDEGETVQHNLGSELTVNLSWKITDDISYETRFDYLTSYTWVRVEWENTITFSVNKYLSTKLYIYGRFDDSSTPTTGSSYFQLKELLSFGLSYSW